MCFHCVCFPAFPLFPRFPSMFTQQFLFPFSSGPKDFYLNNDEIIKLSMKNFYQTVRCAQFPSTSQRTLLILACVCTVCLCVVCSQKGGFFGEILRSMVRTLPKNDGGIQKSCFAAGGYCERKMFILFSLGLIVRLSFFARQNSVQ